MSVRERKIRFYGGLFVFASILFTIGFFWLMNRAGPLFR